MSKEREIELGFIMREYTDKGLRKEEAKRAHEEIFNNYVNMAYKLAHGEMKRLNATHYDIEDAKQDALLALSEAIWLYDPSRGTKVGTFVYLRIKKALSVAIQFAHSVKIGMSGRPKQAIAFEAGKEWDELEEKPKNMTRDEYIFSKTNHSPYQLSLLQSALMGPQSLDAPVNEEYSLNLIDVIEDENSTSGFSEIWSGDFINILSKLSQEEKILIHVDLGLVNDCPEYITNMSNREYNTKVKKVYNKLRKIMEDSDVDY